MTKLLSTALAGVLMAGCSFFAGEDPAPAVLEERSITARSEIIEVMREALGIVSVRLAVDAFVNEPYVVLENAPREGLNAPAVTGRVVQKPERFELRGAGDRCELLHVRTGESYPLRRVRCRPVG